MLPEPTIGSVESWNLGFETPHPDGALRIPVLTLHTTGDGVVPQANEQALASAVREAGAERFLRQLFVGRAGHCSFTAAEQIAALQVLLQRLRSGAWPNDLSPAILDTDARRLGTRLNAVDESDAYRTTHVAPRFVRGDPPKYLRPSLP
jgi:dienelactone hydrolase